MATKGADMSETKAVDLSGRPWPQLILGVPRSFARDRRVLIAAGVLALVLGAAFNWSWLIAVGVAPVLLAVLPCAAMCAVGVCAMSMNHQPAGATTPPTGAAADGSAETQVREKVKGLSDDA
jgi:hypothetical protein